MHQYAARARDAGATSAPSALLRVSRPGDACEMEADRLANHLMLPRKAKGPEEEARVPGVEEPDEKPESPAERPESDEEMPMKAKSAEARQSGGSPLDAGTRSFLESRLAFDFSRVRIHSGERAASSARELDARAYTVGSDIVFGHGQYRPDTQEGRRVLAHELAHVMQQSKTGVMLNRLTTSVSSGATPIQHKRMRRCEWGWTDTETVDVKAKATKKGKEWIAEPTDLRGNYSMRTRLVRKNAEVTGPGGNTTSDNHCKQVEQLDVLGKCGGSWYMLAAVKAHEQVHEKRLAPALKKAGPQITTDFATVKVADAPKKTAAEALAELQGRRAWRKQVKKARTRWDTEFVTLILGDHAGPAAAAEHTVVDPMIQKICAHAKTKAWPACASCP